MDNSQLESTSSDRADFCATDDTIAMKALNEDTSVGDHTSADTTAISDETCRMRPLESSFSDDHYFRCDNAMILSNRRGLIRRICWGGIAGGLLALCSVMLIDFANPGALNDMFRGVHCPGSSDTGTCDAYYYSSHSSFLRLNPPNGIASYMDLFFGRTEEDDSKSLSGEGEHKAELLGTTESSSSDTPTGKHKRQLIGSMEKGAQLVIAGKMTVEEGPCNIAQFNLKTNTWSLTERIQLSLYNSYSGGEVYSLLANHTVSFADNPEGGRYVHLCRVHARILV